MTWLYREVMLMEEIIVPIKGYEENYKVSNLGKVYSNIKGHGFVQIKGWMDYRGYQRVELNHRQFMVHRLVAMAFIPNPENKEQVNHKDENKQNNCVDNLEWMTNAENHNYGTRNQRAGESLKKPILRISRETGEVLQRYVCLKDAVKEGYNHTGISLTANHKGCHHSGGFRWEWENNYLVETRN